MSDAAEIAFVSANLGGIDPAFSLPARPASVDAFYFTDSAAPAPGWATIIVRSGGDPRLRAKRFKCQIHRLNVSAGDSLGYRWLAWADASFSFQSLEFLPQWAELAGSDGAVFIPHPHRETVADEYAYILDLLFRGNEYVTSRYSAAELEAERAHFATRHDLTKLRMLSGGLWLVANTSQVHGFLDAWWAIVQRYSKLDQAAIAPLLVEAGIEPIHAPGVQLYTSQYWRRHSHR